jgi:type II secretory pathway pseudopilin PulG
MPRCESGFTLVEVAIAVLVVALLFGGLLAPLSVQIEQKERERTQAMMGEIKEALYGFAVVHGRLPCPDSDGSNDGAEDRLNGACAAGVVVGNLPWVDLAVPAQDAWGRRFLYRATTSYADDVGLPTVAPGSCPVTPPAAPPAQSSFALCSNGDIRVRDGDASIPGTVQIANDAAAVVISHGKHRSQADPSDPPSPNEEENFEDVTTFPGDTLGTVVVREYTGGTGQEFDDLVIWIPHLILKNRMIMAGKLP